MATPKLIIFAKAPREGEAKSRLAAKLGAGRACEIYRKLLDQLAGNLASLKEVEWHVTPAGAETEFAKWLRPGWKVLNQCEGDLGSRLHHAFETEAVRGGAVIIGSDCPYVTAEDIRVARKELQTHDLVVGPSTDGGYWLIGLKQARPELFQGIDWSTDQVLGQTLRKAKELGLKIQVLRILSDIDTPEDYAEWEREKTGK